jgi:hypothetical protein
MPNNIQTFEDFIKTTLKEEAEGSMYKQKLTDIAKNANDLEKMIADEMELESWVQDKITIANHNMQAIHDYLSQRKDKPADLIQSKPLFNEKGKSQDEKTN